MNVPKYPKMCASSLSLLSGGGKVGEELGGGLGGMPREWAEGLVSAGG